MLCSEMKRKVDELQQMYEDIKSQAETRQAALEQTLGVAEKFWDNLNGMMGTLKELQETMSNQDPPGLEPDIIREQQEILDVSSRFYW